MREDVPLDRGLHDDCPSQVLVDFVSISAGIESLGGASTSGGDGDAFGKGSRAASRSAISRISDCFEIEKVEIARIVPKHNAKPIRIPTRP